MLHSGHVAFLQEAATYGDLYVGIGSDETIKALKGRPLVNGQDERKYMIQALRCVTSCSVNRGEGILDFLPELDDIQPDILIVNEDGATPEKAALCKERNIEYKILKRIPHPGLPARSTTALRTQELIPYRIDLAGTWIDQPYVNRFHPGSAVLISIEPTIEFNERSGMASSTRKIALKQWPGGLPNSKPEELARMLFYYDNPPGTEEVSGSQDALGIVLPGLNKVYYDGSGYWPAKIESVHDENILAWLENHLCMITLWPRPLNFNVLAETNINQDNVKQLTIAAENCWNAILERDLRLFAKYFLDSFHAQVRMFPAMMNDKINKVIDSYSSKSLAWKMSGAGGGGYLILVVENPPEESIHIKIRRRNF